MTRGVQFATFTSGIAVGFVTMLTVLFAYERSMFETLSLEAVAASRRGRM